MKTKDILFITATHGDETVGVLALQELQKRRPGVEWIIANEPAFLQRKRFIDKDLNRSAPGDLNSDKYEVRRSREIINLSKKYLYCLDLHGNDSNTGIFTIVTNPTRANLRLASMLEIKKIVIWPSCTPEMKYPNSEFFSCGLEVECGPKSGLEVANELVNILTKFVDLKKEADYSILDWGKLLVDKEIYVMVGSLSKNEIQKGTTLAEFGPIKINNERLYSIFLGVYPYEGVIGYKLSKISGEEIKFFLSD